MTVLIVNPPSSGSSDENFSYERIITGVTVTIPLYQQMLVQTAITIEGNLVLNGALVVLT